jgi:hypothetical protein
MTEHISFSTYRVQVNKKRQKKVKKKATYPQSPLVTANQGPATHGSTVYIIYTIWIKGSKIGLKVRFVTT